MAPAANVLLTEALQVEVGGKSKLSSIVSRYCEWS